jgi:hypothetical protein
MRLLRLQRRSATGIALVAAPFGDHMVPTLVDDVVEDRQRAPCGGVFVRRMQRKRGPASSMLNFDQIVRTDRAVAADRFEETFAPKLHIILVVMTWHPPFKRTNNWSQFLRDE